jgi:DegV family protein with EDD domain
MPAFHVLTDSNCHIPPSLCNELGIRVVPLAFVWDGTTYYDGVDFALRDFYTRFRNSRALPTTAAPTPGVFLDAFRDLASDGKPILAILVSSDLSSTTRTAELAASELDEADITIVDSKSNTMGLGFQVLAAARAARDGADVAAAVALVEKVQSNSGVVFAVPNLSYLRAGGRIGYALSLLGSALGLIPILEIRDGRVQPVGRARTKARARARVVDLVKERVRGSHPCRIAVLHADAETEAWQIMKSAEGRLNPDELLVSELNPVLAIHVGPETVGIAYSTGV